MNCDKAQEAVSLFVDGELESENREGLFDHLSTCDDCRMFLQGLVQIREIIRQDVASFPERLDDAILDDSRPTRRNAVWNASVRVPVPVAALAAVLIIVVGALVADFLLSPDRGVSQRVTSDLAANDSPPNIIYALPPMDVTASASAESDKK
jgi:predicted anti-sigma-YlaC factor YlaD